MEMLVLRCFLMELGTSKRRVDIGVFQFNWVSSSQAKTGTKAQVI
jgi:hypothetical protein